MKTISLAILLFSIAIFAACGGATGNNQNTSATNTAVPEFQKLSMVDTPQKIQDLMKARGDQDKAKPIIKIIEPKADAELMSSTVKVKLEISGDLKGYKPGMNEETHAGNHIHVILDNQPYEAYYNLDQELELRNVTDGAHTLRVFPSRPWHESFKNDGAFQMVKFTVKSGGADPAKPTTSNGNTVANANAAATPEVKEMKESSAGAVDPTKPLLTYSRPKGEYKGDDAKVVMIDFWLMNAKLKGNGGEFRVSYSVDGGQPEFADYWGPIFLEGWVPGKHTVKLELVDKDGKVVDNGGYNSTTREITITK
ncbi:MAG TPA: hypothetical protein VGO43_06060 [Pyrinomonadaceae bacterium]|jgi:hypothetical protein|nr:hypothetical protein [Pyrinomonadaceae bacterium]